MYQSPNLKIEMISQHQQNTDKYTLLKIVGEGQYGTVFKARNKTNNQDVAIKFIQF